MRQLAADDAADDAADADANDDADDSGDDDDGAIITSICPFPGL